MRAVRALAGTTGARVRGRDPDLRDEAALASPQRRRAVSSVSSWAVTEPYPNRMSRCRRRRQGLRCCTSTTLMLFLPRNRDFSCGCTRVHVMGIAPGLGRISSRIDSDPGRPSDMSGGLFDGRASPRHVVRAGFGAETACRQGGGPVPRSRVPQSPGLPPARFVSIMPHFRWHDGGGRRASLVVGLVMEAS